DGDGNRVRKTITDRNTSPATVTSIFFVVDDRNPTGYAQVFDEYAQDVYGTEISELERGYVYGHALISQWTRSPATLAYYGLDGHGNVRYLTDGTVTDNQGHTGDNYGQITDTYTYDAFGILIASS